MWELYIGSITIYDYSLGLRVQPPLYIAALQLERLNRQADKLAIWYIMAVLGGGSKVIVKPKPRQ